jgi:Cu/Ag efflux pump CusA
MFETIINLKPKAEWRRASPSTASRQEMDKALQFPGVSNAWTMPIRARIDMLSTGIRTPVGVKVFGTDLAEMERIARQIETVLKAVPGTSAPMPSASSAATTSTSCRTGRARPLRADVGDVQDGSRWRWAARP